MVAYIPSYPLDSTLPFTPSLRVYVQPHPLPLGLTFIFYCVLYPSPSLYIQPHPFAPALAFTFSFILYNIYLQILLSTLFFNPKLRRNYQPSSLPQVPYFQPHSLPLGFTCNRFFIFRSNLPLQLNSLPPRFNHYHCIPSALSCILSTPTPYQHHSFLPVFTVKYTAYSNLCPLLLYKV